MAANDTARSEATRWLILLQEQPDDRALKAAFEAWLAASPVNAAAWVETSHVGVLIAQNPPRYRSQWQRPRLRPARRIAFAAVALAVAAAIVIALMPSLLLRFTADYATGTAELREVPLPDGSLARLAPDSAIDVDCAAGKRSVRLLAGALFLEVEPDAARPFVVSSEAIETTVLGTAFEVRLDGDEVTVAVRHGSVRIEGPGLHELLGPGDWLSGTASGKGEHGSGSPDVAGAWVRGELFARDRPVADIVTELRAYFHGAIFITDDELAALRVTGIYDLDDPAQTLRAVAMTHQATLRQISPWILVLSKD